MRTSYSSIETYRICPLKYKFKHIDKIAEPRSKEAVFGTLIHSALRFIHTPAIVPPSLEAAIDFFAKSWNEEVFEDEIEERAAFTQGVQMLQRYYEDNRIAEANIVDLESRFSLEIGDEKRGIHTVSGIIDRIDRTADGYEIIDYKTTRKMPSQEKVDQDLQLSIYLKAFLGRYPKERENLDKITVSLYYLKHGVKLSSKRTLADLEALVNQFLEVIQAIEGEQFEPILSPLCDWCGYKKICPLWKHQYRESRTVENAEAEKAIEEFVTLRRQMASEKKRLGELQALILDYMEQEKVERVFGQAGILAKSLRSTYKYEPEKLRAVLEPLDKWESVLKVDGIALRNILATLPAMAKKGVADAKELDKTSTTLSIKKAALIDDEE